MFQTKHKNRSKNSFRFINFLKFIAILSFIFALARPQKSSEAIFIPKPVVDIVIALDTSESMQAMDFNPYDRLSMAKKSAIEFIKKRPYDRIGLVVFGGDAIIQCPMTTDHDVLINFLETVPINATKTQGTAIGTAIVLSAQQIISSDTKSKIIILLTDGSNNAGAVDPLTAVQTIKDLDVRIYTIGTATPDGGKIQVNDPMFGKRWVQMRDDLDEEMLSQVASVTGGKYFRVQSKNQFKNIYDEINALEKTDVQIDPLIKYHEFYPHVLFVGWIIFCFALLLESIFFRKIP